MNSTKKLLRAFIGASGFDIETTEDIKRFYHPNDVFNSGKIKQYAQPENIIKTTNYKVTKRVKVITQEDITSAINSTRESVNL